MLIWLRKHIFVDDSEKAEELLPQEMDSRTEFTCFSILIHNRVSKSQLPKGRKKKLSHKQTCCKASQNVKELEIS